MDSLYIVIPAYNESDNIAELIDEWYPIVEQYNGNGRSRLVIINDGSKDNTYELLLQFAQERPLLQPITKPNGGHGSTVLYGYRYAVENKADYIFQTDSDRQTTPEEFHQFWSLRNMYEAILGKRPDRQDGASRKFVENVLRLILWIVFGVRVPDANAPFRLMKTELVKKYIQKMPEDFNLPNVMFTTYFVYFKHNIIFRNVTFRPRQGGVNSINVKKIIKIGWKAIGDFFYLKKFFNDMESETNDA